eukprot:SAG22_NODE_6261_length_878_cov_1.385109_1_plen_20_part_10
MLKGSAWKRETDANTREVKR